MDSPAPPRLRIIPARAGFTLCDMFRPHRRWDHPRSRGVYPVPRRRTHPPGGSSPLARGLRTQSRLGGRGRRIIPARAGFTRCSATMPRPAPDHPRSRGVYSPGLRDQPRGEGSSPLARGLLHRRRRLRLAHGIIPARAGFTPSARKTRWSRRDHPRSRGVYVGLKRAYKSCTGSSPLARGLRSHPLARKCVSGIIPARAGFTPRRPGSTPWVWDHPRSRGVYGATPAVVRLACGSSPLARGLPVGRLFFLGGCGIIPARAGFTPTPRCRAGARSDHPRSRGVYLGCAFILGYPIGSSPLARGLLSGWLGGGAHEGIIPARAGFTFHPGGRARLARDHPRSRGVYRKPFT